MLADDQALTRPVLKRPRMQSAWPYMLVAPALLVLLVTVMYPIGFNLFAAMHR